MFDKKFLGVGTVGERGQVAIPKQARKKINIKSGEKLIFLSLPKESGFMAVKADNVSKFIEKMIKKTESIKRQLKKLQ